MKLRHLWLFLATCFTVLTAHAQPWPSKNIRMIVPFAAGGPADLVARELGQVLAADLKQTVTVENMGGAMGVPALSAVARAEPDGHTWLLLKPIGPVSTAPHVLVVSSQLPIKSVSELTAYAKANPGRISFASAGTGGLAHLGMEMYKQVSGTDVLHVPYKGSSGAVNDLISGQVSALFSSLPSLQGLVDKGYVRLLAATAPSSSPATRQLPLMSASLPGYEYATWYGMYVPASTPAALVERMNLALNRALKQSALVAKVEAAGTELHPGTPDDVLQWTRRDTDKWQRVIQSANIRVD